MSGWIVALKDLYRYGGVAGVSLVGDRYSRKKLASFGLARRMRHARVGPEAQLQAMARKTRNDERFWTITDLGRDVVEGRVEIRRGLHGKITFVATLLASLPQVPLDPPAPPPRPVVEREPMVSPPPPKTAAREHPWRRGISW